VPEPLLMGSRTRCQPSLNWCLNRFNRCHALLDWLVMDLWRLDVRTCLVGPVKANAPSTSGFFCVGGECFKHSPWTNFPHIQMPPAFLQQLHLFTALQCPL
jgi:hypothetical protein